MEEVLLAAGGKRSRNELPVSEGKKGKKKTPYRRQTLPTPRFRDERGKFISSFKTVTASGEGLSGRTYTVSASERSRVKAIRTKRRVVLNALKEARARGLRDGTIKRLKEASRQLLHQSQLARGL